MSDRGRDSGAATAIGQWLDAYGLTEAHAVKLESDWNSIYQVTAEQRRFTLRICPAVIQDSTLIDDEVRWMAHVRDQTDLAVPQALPNRNGGLVTRCETDAGSRIGCLFTWVDGTPLDQSALVRQMAAVGRLAGQLHAAARTFDAHIVAAGNETGAFRAGYRYDQALVRSHLLWIDEHGAALGADRAAILRRAVAQVLRALDDEPHTAATVGVIHGDLHFGNILRTGCGLGLIDFEQSGVGYFAYDLAVILVELEDALTLAEDETAARWQDLRRGYGDAASTAAPTAAPSMEDLAPFSTAVRLGFLDWIMNTDSQELRTRYQARVERTFARLQATT